MIPNKEAAHETNHLALESEIMGTTTDKSPQSDSHHRGPCDLDGTGIGTGADDLIDQTPDCYGSGGVDLSSALSHTTPDQAHWADSPYRLVSMPDAAQFLDISRSMLYEIANSGQLPTVSIGRRTMIPRLCLEEFVRERIHRASWP